MKRMTALLAVAMVFVLMLGAVAEPAQLENPWVDFGTDLDAAAEAAGIALAIPALSNYSVRVIPGEMIEVRYPRDDASEIELRKSLTEPESGDISGDFTEYPESAIVELESGVEVYTRGREGLVCVAAFVAFDGAYSVRCEAGMSQDEALQIVDELLTVNAQ